MPRPKSPASPDAPRPHDEASAPAPAGEPSREPVETTDADPTPVAPSGDADPATIASPAGAAGDAAASAAPSTDDALDETPEGARPRRRSAEPEVTPPPPDRLEGAVEAVLLAAGESLSAERVRDLLGLPSAVHVRDAIAAIRAKWTAAGLSVEIQDVAGGHRVVTRPEYAEYVRRLWRRATSDRLSQTLLETLSIVAYKQPVARAEIERIRGVQCGESLRALLERRLVKVAGRSDQPGRPLLYATTARFLEVFGLAGLDDLPNAKDLARL